jgi:UDP:flavonoid glycosyltransferase YjiC (YdhE family)
VIPQRDLTPQGLRDGLLRLLAEDRFADGADRLRSEMLSDPSPADVVSALEKLTARHQRFDV